MATITAVAFRLRNAAGSRPADRNAEGFPSTAIRSAVAIAAWSPSALPPLRYSASGVERSAPTQRTTAPRSANRRPATAAARPSPNCTTRNPASSDIAPPRPRERDERGRIGQSEPNARLTGDDDAGLLFRAGIECDGDAYRAA